MILCEKYERFGELGARELGRVWEPGEGQKLITDFRGCCFCYEGELRWRNDYFDVVAELHRDSST